MEESDIQKQPAGSGESTGSSLTEKEALQAQPSPTAPQCELQEKAPPSPTELNWSSKIMLAYAVGFGTGYSPKAPGTAGTLVGVLIHLAIARLHPAIQILTVLTLTMLAFHAARIAGRYFGNSDDQHIVSDEIAGYLITMLLVPADPLKLAAGFIFFRMFDILKPWPCSYFDKKMKNAAGNVMDDVCAGIYGRILMFIWVIFW